MGIQLNTIEFNGARPCVIKDMWTTTLEAFNKRGWGLFSLWVNAVLVLRESILISFFFGETM